jgi:micrococcal nuclease
LWVEEPWRNWFARHPVWTGVLAFFVIMFVIGLFSDEDTGTSTTTAGQPPPVTQPTTAAPVPPAPPQGVPSEAEAATVESITDGDTLALRGERAGDVFASTAQITVRLLEVDTPETKHPSQPVQCYGPEATAFLGKIAPVGSTVWAIPDTERTDRYGRDLLYLWDEAGSFVNLEIVRTGHGKAVLYEPNDRFIEQMRAAEAEAKAAKRGLWGACVTAAPKPAPKPTTAKPAPEPEPEPEPDVYYANCTEARSAGAAPLYRGDPGYRSGLDRDDDGVACE